MMAAEAAPRSIIARLRPTGWGAWWAYGSLIAMPLLVLLCALMVGLRVEHVAFGVAYLVLAWMGPGARRFSAVSAPFVATGLAYDFLRLAISWRSSHIHIGDLRDLDATLFPVPASFGATSLTEAVAALRSRFLDAITGIAYIVYLPEVFLVATYLYVKGDHPRAQTLAWVFTATSVLGWIIWLAWPAAPPWYVDHYGVGPAVLDAPPSPAGGARFDALINVPVFAHFYHRSWNIFGAMPSLHTSYAVLTAAVCWSKGGGVRIFTTLFACDIAFAAVYLHHHYVLDVVLGAALALLVSWVVGRLMSTPQSQERGLRAARSKRRALYELG